MKRFIYIELWRGIGLFGLFSVLMLFSCAAPLRTRHLIRVRTGSVREDIKPLNQVKQRIAAEVTNDGIEYHLEIYPAAIGHSTIMSFGGGPTHHVETDPYAFVFRNDTLIHHDFLFTLHRVHDRDLLTILELLRPAEANAYRKRDRQWPVHTSRKRVSHSWQRW